MCLKTKVLEVTDPSLFYESFCTQWADTLYFGTQKRAFLQAIFRALSGDWSGIRTHAPEEIGEK